MIKVFPRLQTVWLGQLPKLVRFCCGDYIEFPMLSTLQIEECPQFTAFVSNEVNGVVHDVPCLFNDKVSYVQLERLRQLKSFYPSMHTTEWPALKELEVKAYSNVKVFAPKNLNSQPDTLTGTEQPLFWFSKDAFPCLEVFDTDQADAMEIFKLNKNQESTIR
ncbi:disease resistance protein [Corchorus olitorius]|uniref:Disease resistance protein n=1 Tax=Corchorus olitorius TaxID=93759 RepID=A0A1R3JVZ8_9ROSI|nr:disease resistance protein [Corchorus olitorius]